MTFPRLNKVVCLAFLFLSSPLHSYTEKPDLASRDLSFEAHLDFLSRYVWRGMAYSAGAVWQPSGILSYRDFSLNAWGNFVLNDEYLQGKMNEVDVTLGYEWEKGPWSFEPQLAFYLYPADDTPHTADLMLPVAYDFGLLSLTLLTSVDVWNSAGGYFGQAGLLWEEEWKNFKAMASLSLGWGNAKFNDTYLGVDTKGMNLLEVNAAIDRRIVKKLWVKPHVSLSQILDGDLIRAVDDPFLYVVGLDVWYEW